MDYLIRFRIQRAANLLKETTSSIADISAAVGITDQNLFSRTFKRITGISPRIYRTKLSEAESAKEV
jgi:AraC family L-rhamnose operon transcriptional activator RhaR/AraC family L-rhamnose operon regulatory protein RhaS